MSGVSGSTSGIPGGLAFVWAISPPSPVDLLRPDEFKELEAVTIPVSVDEMAEARRSVTTI